MTSIFHKCLERWASLNKACLDALSAVDQLDQQIMLPGMSQAGWTNSNDIQGRFDAISDQIMNLDVKVGDQVELNGKHGRGMASLEMSGSFFLGIDGGWMAVIFGWIF